MAKSSNNVNPSAGSARAGNLPRQSAVKAADAFNTENLDRLARVAFGAIDGVALASVATCTVALLFAVQVRGDKLATAKAALVRRVVGADDSVPMNRINGTVREHAKLAAFVVKEEMEYGTYNVRNETSVAATIETIHRQLRDAYVNLNGIKAVAGGKGGVKRAPLTVPQMIAKRWSDITVADAGAIADQMAVILALAGGTLDGAVATLADVTTTLAAHRKAADDSAAKRKPFTRPADADGGKLESVADVAAALIATLAAPADADADADETADVAVAA